PLHVVESRAHAHLRNVGIEFLAQRLGATKALLESLDDFGRTADHRIIHLGVDDQEHVERRCQETGGVGDQPRTDPARELDVELAGVAEVRARCRQVGDVDLAAAHAVEKADEASRFVEAVIAVGRLDAFGKRAAVEARLGPPGFMTRLLEGWRESLACQRVEALLQFPAFVGSEIAKLDVHLETSSNTVTRPFFSPATRRLPSGDQRITLMSESSIWTSMGSLALRGRHSVSRQSRPALTRWSPPGCQAKLSTRSV